MFSPHHVNQGGVQKATPQVTLYKPHTAEESFRRHRAGRHSQVLPVFTLFHKAVWERVKTGKKVKTTPDAIQGAIYESRKRERSDEDGLFMPHQKGPITATFTADWFLREGQGRELLEEWMKLTSVRSQDQRRMLRANSYTFPTNDWIHKITKGKESDRCDLCRPSG